jgi:hypothetical protein
VVKSGVECDSFLTDTELWEFRIWPVFLAGSPESVTLKKFLASKISLARCGCADILGLEKAVGMYHGPGIR